MSPSVISLIGILLGMVILVFLAFKGYNVIIVSVIAALVVAVFAGTDILPLITDSYMTKFADFAKNNFMIFLLSAVFGKLMGDSGAADTIAYSMLRVVNHVHSQRTKQLVGGLMITAIVAVLTYGGVSLFVVIFTLISIGRKLFEELDIPWRHYLTFHGIGSATFTMTMLPGTAALQNIIPTQYLGTTPMAGAAIGLLGIGQIGQRRVNCRLDVCLLLIRGQRCQGHGGHVHIGFVAHQRPAAVAALIGENLRHQSLAGGLLLAIGALGNIVAMAVQRDQRPDGAVGTLCPQIGHVG